MGNVQASESGVPPPGMSPSAPASEERNPGTVEDLHKECKEIFPMAFEGAKLVVQKALSNNFQVLLKSSIEIVYFTVEIPQFRFLIL